MEPRFKVSRISVSQHVNLCIVLQFSEPENTALMLIDDTDSLGETKTTT